MKSQFLVAEEILFIGLLRAHTLGDMARKIADAFNAGSVTRIKECQCVSHLGYVNQLGLFLSISIYRTLLGCHWIINRRLMLTLSKNYQEIV